MQITVSDSGSRFKVRAVLMFWHTGCSVSLIKEPLDLKQYCVHFLQSTSFSTTLSKLSISGQSISPLTLTCLLCVLPHHCQSNQLFRKLIISLLYLTRNVVSSSSAHVWIVHVSMHMFVRDCACVCKPSAHNDYSAITEVIKTSADCYQGRQREWRDHTATGYIRKTRPVLHRHRNKAEVWAVRRLHVPFILFVYVPRWQL